MSVKYTITLLVVSLLLTGCSAGQKAKPDDNSTSSGESNTSQEVFTGGLKAAMALGVPMTCSVTDADGTSITTFVKGDQYYAETNSNGLEGRIIVKDNCTWTWQPGMNQGFTGCFDPQEIHDTNETSSEDSLDRIPEDVDYQCRPAVIGDDKFTPPSDVAFTDFSQMMSKEIPTEVMPGLQDAMQDLSAEDKAELEKMMQQFGQ